MFDWRALKRWGIPESRLPPGSEVRFKPQSMWEQYRWYIIAELIIIGLQAAMIGDLLLQRWRRRRVEAELRENQELMELAASAGELGLWSRNLTDGKVWANAPCVLCLASARMMHSGSMTWCRAYIPTTKPICSQRSRGRKRLGCRFKENFALFFPTVMNGGC